MPETATAHEGKNESTSHFLARNLLAFILVVAAYGLILDYSLYTIFDWPLSLPYVIALGCFWYLAAYELPGIIRKTPEAKPIQVLTAALPSSTKERGRQTVEDSTGKKVQ